ncbi:MAG: hypothetical protein RLZZ116_2483 [Planctomycetota bacterium]|jgi:hypothetical protein
MCRTRSERWYVADCIARIASARTFHRSGRVGAASAHGASPRVPPPAFDRRRERRGESREESERRLGTAHPPRKARRVARRAGATHQPRARWMCRTRSERWYVADCIARIAGARTFHRSGRVEAASEHGASPRVPPGASRRIFDAHASPPVAAAEAANPAPVKTRANRLENRLYSRKSRFLRCLFTLGRSIGSITPSHRAEDPRREECPPWQGCASRHHKE